MWAQVRAAVVSRLPEPTLRRMDRVRHRESPGLAHMPQRAPGRGEHHIVRIGFDAHAEARANAAAVTAALESHGVPFVSIPAAHGQVRQVAVGMEWRGFSLIALEAALGDEWCTVPSHLGPTTNRVRYYRRLAAPDGSHIGGPELACEVAFWPAVQDAGRRRTDGGTYPVGTRIAPSDNGVAAYLSAQAWEESAAAATHWREEQRRPFVFEVSEPIDAVYTWVDGGDPAWLARKAGYLPAAELDHTAIHAARYLSRDELRYSLRSLVAHANWVRHVYVVTDAQVPRWLDRSSERISVVDHRDIFRDPSVLPVYNSHAIESQLHHISGLSERYLYLNDDVFFGARVEPEDFFYSNGVGKFFLSAKPLDVDGHVPGDLPLMSAAKNQRELIAADFGRLVTHRLQHTAHPQQRAVLAELEQRHPELFERVAASRFRHPDDVSIAAALAHYYSYCTARAVPAQIEYVYHDVGRHDTGRRLDGLLRTRPQLFCLNDVASPPDQAEALAQLLAAFLAAYFPVPAPFELAT